MLTPKQALNEAQRQKQALRTIGSWRRVMFVLSACAVALAAWGFTAGVLPAGIAGAVLGLAGMALTLLIHRSMVCGEKNVEAILAALEAAGQPAQG